MKPQNLVVFVKSLKTEDLCGTSKKIFVIKRKIQAYLLLHYTTFAHPASSFEKKSFTAHVTSQSISFCLSVYTVSVQRRQSGLKSGRSWIGVKKMSILRGKFPKISIFSGNFTKII